MRFYDLSLIDSQGRLLQSTSAGFVPSTNGLPTFSSRIRQQGGVPINNPGALNIEFDIPVVGYALPQGGSWVRISGVGLRTIGQSSDLNADDARGRGPTNFLLSAGMIKGLPLANPAQAGVIAQGEVYNAYGNWQGPEQSLDLNLIAGNIAPPQGVPIVWSPNQTLASALKNTFSTAFPGLKTTNADGSSTITIHPGFIQSQSTQDVSSGYKNLQQLADFILQNTKVPGAKLTGNPYYPGVQIGIKGKTIYATDGTQNSTSVGLAFQDLIGQPTWMGINTISFKTVLRADIQMGDFITMPTDPGTGGTSIMSALSLTQQAAAKPGAPARDASTFKGKFYINEVHHFGNLRQPDADSWATAFTAIAVG